jgi:hypothetical protein
MQRRRKNRGRKLLNASRDGADAKSEEPRDNVLRPSRSASALREVNTSLSQVRAQQVERAVLMAVGQWPVLRH